MKLVPKLTCALVIAVTTVLVTSAWVRVTREKTLFAMDMRRDHRVVGHMLAASVAEAFSRGGRTASLEAIRTSHVADSRIRVRLCDHENPDNEAEMSMISAALPPDGTSLEGVHDGQEFLYTYIPVPGQLDPG